jgi:hypothetical protein
LNTRADDDFAVALVDAWAAVLDVLTFYQERIANESYERTATEWRSIAGLSALIGREPGPGVAATVWLVFAVEDAPGGPDHAVIDSGTKVQSVPEPGQEPQIFETVEPIEARSQWNAIKPRLTQPHPLTGSVERILVAGLVTSLKPGDGLLITPENGSSAKFRQVAEVTPEPERDCTEVRLQPLSPNNDEPLTDALATQPPPVLAFRSRASIFGHNAPGWDTLPANQRFGEWVWEETSDASGKTDYRFELGVYADRSESWAETTLDKYHDGAPDSIYLDNLYPNVVKDSYVLLREKNGVSRVYHVDNVTELTKSDFSLAGKISRLTLNTSPGLNDFTIRETTVFAESEELELVPLPIDVAVSESDIEVEGLIGDLLPGQLIIVCGELEADGGNRLSELACIADVEPVHAENYTRITLTKGLANNYVRSTVTINANVARATHGETVGEVLGSGDASRAFQGFQLRQPPLTYLSAPTTSGLKSTLEVRADGVLWKEVPTLFGCGSTERVYTLRTDADGSIALQFGDGRTGARLPTGQDNVRATYRRGTGVAGFVKAGQLSVLLTRPSGVKGVTNPLDSQGAEDPETLVQARRNVPLTIKTLDRVVSLQDYQDFAAAYAGITKAMATWTWGGNRRGVFLTIAGPDGSDVKGDSSLAVNLLSSVRRISDPHIPVRAGSYRKASFHLSARIRIHQDYLAEEVCTLVAQQLSERFGFTARALGRPVTASEVIAVIQQVPAVVSAELIALHRVGDPGGGIRPYLNAAPPEVGPQGILGAELLLIDEASIDLRVIP